MQLHIDNMSSSEKRHTAYITIHNNQERHWHIHEILTSIERVAAVHLHVVSPQTTCIMDQPSYNTVHKQN